MTDPAPGQARVALGVLAEADVEVAGGNPADRYLRKLFHQRRTFGSRDRRFVSGLVFSWFRWRGWLTRIAPEPTPLTTAAAYRLDAIEPHPAIDLLAEGLNLPLLGDASTNDKATALTAAFPGRDFAWKHLVPEWLPAALPDTIDLPDLVLSFQQRPPAWLACRNPEPVIACLKRQDMPHTRHPVLDLALAVDPTRHLPTMLRDVEGLWEIQDLASQAVGKICAPSPGQAWWDTCAGSGGKALTLAHAVGPAGAVLATDVRDLEREFSRRTRAARLRNLVFRVLDAALQSPAGGERFDGVLVDAPCSGIGTWSRNPDARWRTSADDIAHRAELQRTLLANAARSVKSGGALVYAVCTLTRAETLGVVETFLSAHPGFALEPFPHPLTGASTGGQIQILPADGPGDGMFIARFRKAG